MSFSRTQLIRFAALGAIFLLSASVLYLTTFSHPKKGVENEGIIEDQQTLLVAPEHGTEMRYQRSVEHHAVETPTISIGKDCAVSPLIAKVYVDDFVTFHNTDSVIHVLEVSEEKTSRAIILPPDTLKVLDPREFVGNTGTLRYQCTDRSKEVTVGVIYVEE